MADGPNLLVCRLSIFSAMVAAVFTLLYLAPVPDQSFKNCDRPCHDLDWPMICRFKLIIEKLPTSVICQNCHNSSNCSFCSSPTDLPQQILTANRQLPAPPIHVCHNDIIIVDVINKLQGQSLTMHWRGQNNEETPFMDGVPLITQCPIGAFTTFQYKLRASSPGTHTYHAFSDSERSSGLYGALIVRKAEKLEENKDHFDVDHKDHVLVLSQSKDVILINGVGPSSASLSRFSVKEGTNNRFRIIYASGTECPLELNLDYHLLKVIAIDGNPVKPAVVSSIKLTKGETLDFILAAHRPHSSYYIKVKSSCNSKDLHGKAMVTYEGSPMEQPNGNFIDDQIKSDADVGDCETKNGKVCLEDIQNSEEMDTRLLTVDKRIYLGFDRVGSKNDRGLSAISSSYYRTNNISFVFPPSPMLTQPTYVPVDLMCNESFLPERCRESERCDCVHLEHIPLGSSTEIVLIDQGQQDEDNGYIFHLHGYHFYVVGTKILEKPVTKQEVEALDINFDFIKRNVKNPLMKSTVRVPKHGMVAIRFLANNPGFWILRDENAKGWTRGLDILFQVGDTGDIVDLPTDFPTCGNFIGPDFFLL